MIILGDVYLLVTTMMILYHQPTHKTQNPVLLVYVLEFYIAFTPEIFFVFSLFVSDIHTLEEKLPLEFGREKGQKHSLSLLIVNDMELEDLLAPPSNSVLLRVVPSTATTAGIYLPFYYSTPLPPPPPPPPYLSCLSLHGVTAILIPIYNKLQIKYKYYWR